MVFEGLDGCGKTTQIGRVEGILKGKGIRTLRTHEPGGSQLGARLRQILLEESPTLCARAELMLFMADRAEHVEKVIRPALEEGMVVLCDRYYHSTLAYQGGGLGLPMDVIRAVNEAATGGLEPEVVVLLDIEPAKALERLSKEDIITSRGLGFLKRVREVYLELAKADERFLVLDATLNPDSLSRKISERLLSTIANRRPEERLWPTSRG